MRGGQESDSITTFGAHMCAMSSAVKKKKKKKKKKRKKRRRTNQEEEEEEEEEEEGALDLQWWVLELPQVHAVPQMPAILAESPS